MSRLRIDAPLASGKACGMCRYFTRSPYAVEVARAMQNELGSFDPNNAGVCAHLPDLVVVAEQACCRQWNPTRNWTGGVMGRLFPVAEDAARRDPLFGVMKLEKAVETDEDQIDSQRFHNIEKGQ